ncbi:MAG: energy transducer TonB [Acidobacteria bacterium]|nr:energy transducer TonB [Acidobacteriota bacterium]
MNRAVAPLFLGIVLSVTSVLAQETPPQTTKPAEATPTAPPAAPKYLISDWKPFQSKEGNFSVIFPTPPKEETKRYRLQSGLSEDHRYIVPTSNGNYQVAYTFLSENLATPEMIRERFDNLLKNLKVVPNLKWISGGEISYEGNPGIEFKAQYSEGPRTITLWSRQFFAFGCVYEIAARYTTQEPELKEPAMFIESFKLWGPPARRPALPALTQESLPDFTPLAQGMYYITPEKLREQALEKPELSIGSTGRVSRGTVTVLVTVSPEGKVIQIEPSDGFPAFYEEAIKAAKKWTFKPFLLNGTPVKVQGRLTFKFGTTGTQNNK